MEKQCNKGILVMDYLENLGVGMMTIGTAIEDENVEKSYQLITKNPKISKAEFLNRMGLEEEED